MLRRVYSMSCVKSIAALPSRRLAQCAAINSNHHRSAVIQHNSTALFNGARTMVTKMRGRSSGRKVSRGELRTRPGGAAAATAEGESGGAKGKEQTAEKGAFLLSMLPQMKGKLAPPITKDTITRAQEYLRDPANKDVPLRRLVMIDVRSFDKTQWGPTVPDAYNIPLEEVANGTFMELYEAQQQQYTTTDESAQSKHRQTLEMLGMKSFLDLPQPEDNVVLFGEDADDGEFGCIMFKKLGFKNVFNYRGGIMDWFDLEYIPLRRRRREAHAQ